MPQALTARYLLDTNIVTELVAGDESVLSNYRRIHRRRILIPIIVYAESLGGWIHKIDSEKNKARVPLLYRALHRCHQVMRRHEILSLSEAAIKEFESLPRGKPPIGERDRLIAACAVTTGYLLVTRDRHFEQLLPTSQPVDWTQNPFIDEGT